MQRQRMALIHRMAKYFGPPKGTELPILNVTQGIVDNGTAPSLLSWTVPIKEVMQISAYITVRPKEVSEMQTGKWPHIPCLFTCFLTLFSAWHYLNIEAVSNCIAISSASYVRLLCFSFPSSSQSYSSCSTSWETAFLRLISMSCPAVMLLLLHFSDFIDRQ